MRLYFERLPDQPPLDTRAEFLAHIGADILGRDYLFAGYIVMDLGRVWYNHNVVWNVLLQEDSGLLCELAQAGWQYRGYVVHAELEEEPGTHVWVPNRGFRPEPA